MCFERAGDKFWEKLAEASLYQEAARTREPHSEMARKYLKKAAEIFDAIGKAESAARLFIEIEEFERAGINLFLTFYAVHHIACFIFLFLLVL